MHYTVIKKWRRVMGKTARMIRRRRIFSMGGWLLFLISIASCKKGWLDVKSNQSLVVPSKIEHFQAMMDHDYIMNLNRPGLGDIGSDVYFLLYANWTSISSPYQVQSHIWADDIYQGSVSPDWNTNYEKIYYANLVLEGLEGITPSAGTQAAWNNAKGSALFFRAMALHDLAQLFCKPYDISTASTDPGIPVRLSSNLNVKSQRGTVEQVYQKVLSDLQEAAQLLPEQQSYRTRPTRAAALALLSRVHLSMENYGEAFSYAKDALALQSALMDYNTNAPGVASPFEEFNEEVIFHARVGFFAVIDARHNSRAFVDSNLYKSYHDNDLRKTKYFNIIDNGYIQFTGDYAGDAYPSAYGYFGGLATDELYLTKAECEARAGDKDDALATLNTLLETRWASGTFVPFTAATADDALAIILEERKKSLLFRGLRWSDLRRLNRDNRFAVTIKREFDNGTVYTLEPNSVRYVWPIPPDEIAISGLEQNPR